ncbi:MAG: DUF1016 domain-containing protein [Mariniphaga sp.]|nr:DUF1016 domain-containing protein [Mariniphaga sp.]
MDFSLQNEFYSEIKILIERSRTDIYKSDNFAVVKTYWQIGKRIFEEEEKRKEQIDIGEILTESLGALLSGDFGNSFDVSNLMYMRRFFSTFPILNVLRTQLSWSHYRLIIDEEEQAQIFYMNKAADNHWSVQQLSQQIESKYYSRTHGGSLKDAVSDGLTLDELQCKPSDLFRDPFLLEFLDFKNLNLIPKHELEQAILDRIHDYLLELANGFCFVTRQKHVATEQNEHYHIDLVYYNYLLRCFVLVNLRLGEITSEDELILDRYVQMYDDKIKPKDDNPTFGILICSHNGETEVKYSQLNDRKQIFSTLYQLVIPSKEELSEIVTAEITTTDKRKSTP